MFYHSVGANISYTSARTACQNCTGGAGRLATFATTADYIGVISGMTLAPPAPAGANNMWVGLRDAGTTPYWEDPPSNLCAPPMMNLTALAATNVIIKNLSASTDTMSVGPGWNTWSDTNINTQLYHYMCEFGNRN